MSAVAVVATPVPPLGLRCCQLHISRLFAVVMAASDRQRHRLDTEDKNVS